MSNYKTIPDGLGGYCIEMDNEKVTRDFLENNAANMGDIAHYATMAPAFDIEALDPRKWCRQERQATNDCQAFAQTATCEAAFTVATGTIIQFSPFFSYKRSQFYDRIMSDAGSSIAGGLKAASTDGSCPLEVCPYPVPYNYNRKITQEQMDAAKAYLIKSWGYMRSYDDCLAWILSGNGGINWGTRWGFTGNINPRGGGVLERWAPGPGHATALLGPSTKKDSKGRPYLWMWDSGWPQPGWYETSADAINQAFRDSYTVAIGMTKLEHPVPQVGTTFNPMGL